MDTLNIYGERRLGVYPRLLLPLFVWLQLQYRLWIELFQELFQLVPECVIYFRPPFFNSYKSHRCPVFLVDPENLIDVVLLS